MSQWLSLIALAAVVPTLAQTSYIIPYADGSDGWNDAYQQAKGELLVDLRDAGADV